MKKIFEKLLSYFILAIILYFILSLIHLSWYIANPEGFFGFTYFIEVVRAVLSILLVLLILVFGGWALIASLLSLIKRKSSIKDLLKLIGIIGLLVVIIIFNSVWAGGLSYIFTSELSEKYSLINKTEEYLYDGEIEKALKLASKSYEKEQDRNIGWFFILTKLYSKTNYDKKEKLLSRYSSTLNYGYCLKGIVSNSDTGEGKFKEAITIANSNLLNEERNELLIFPLLSLSEINLSSERFKAADEYFKKLSSLQKQSQPEDAYYLINTYMLFSAKASAIGDFTKSIKLQNEALNIYEESDLSKTSKNYLSLLLAVSLGELYNENFTNAANLLIKSQPIAEDKDDTSAYLDYLSIKGNYCFLSAINGKGDERLLEKSFWKKITNSSSEKLSLKNKLLNQAEDCFNELVEKSKDLSGRHSGIHVNALITLANYYYLTSQFVKAKSNFDIALSMLENSKKENEDFYYQIYLKSLLNERQLTDVNINKLNKIESLLFEKLNTNYAVLTEEEKETYTISLQKYLNLVNDFYVKEDSEVSRKRLYNNITSIKSMALSSNIAIRSYIKDAEDSIKSSYNQILNQKKQFKMKSFGFENLQESEELKVKEKTLLENIYNDPKFKSHKPKSIDWKNIKNALKPGEVAIEFINLPQNHNKKPNSEYYALLIGLNYSSPKLIKLFNENDLKGLLNTNGNTQTRVNSIYNLNHKKLYSLVFSPIENFLEDNSVIYISKSGLLHNISFSALTKDKLWDIRILQNTNHITERDELNTSNKAVLFGGIDYNIESDSIKERTGNLLNNKYKSLNYTLSEVNNIASLFMKDTNKTSITYTKTMASETSFRKLSGSETDIIHLATHGYYNGNNKFNSFIYSNINNGQFESSPLLRSGILLAGANNSSYSNTNNDGIMTSLEISEMDFSKVDLVVLSACETGLGDVLGSEGVFGLQRAFKLAGAKSLIVSLWQVPDEQTSELMLKFYAYYLNGNSKTQALRNAQNDIKMNYPNPYFWAGFELIE
ncbi:CHAT domain-containing protein [Winogradskyella sp. F6397]|uniref:CHAT domain-containing protein n=1 Tax=Winogradskyella marina TaxID=2785530 RepID=A0ABS0EFR6_9FLAO|nr:CHAT domain-containing tetratricopeptide repeat protein [Winogradskyella marina]MBF8149267.1 CHAT domain-containing protein [Winogradskyella marina]